MKKLGCKPTRLSGFALKTLDKFCNWFNVIWSFKFDIDNRRQGIYNYCIGNYAGLPQKDKSMKRLIVGTVLLSFAFTIKAMADTEVYKCVSQVSQFKNGSKRIKAQSKDSESYKEFYVNSKGDKISGDTAVDTAPKLSSK